MGRLLPELRSFSKEKICFSFLIENLDLLSDDIKNSFLLDYEAALSQKRSLQSLLFGSSLVSLKKDVSSKTIWFFWFQGLNDAPDVVRISLKSWVFMNPDYDVVFLDSSNLHTYFPFWDSLSLSNLRLKIAHKSDFLRTFLIYYYGGIWVDATTFCFKPLSFWLPGVLERSSLFFPKQKKTCKDRIIKNWLLAGVKGNPLAKLLLEDLYSYIFQYRANPLGMINGPAYMHSIKLDPGSSTLDYFTNTCLKVFEGQGVFPYFFYHYVYNNVVLNSKDGSEVKQVASFITGFPDIIPENKRAAITDSVFVSKQSYRKRHTDSDEYRERRELVLRLIESF